ncbi:hypothetical protein MMC07_008227 [Pseudocyphellaria aurata]|nr:hypothetical protein [Pseudocyphellaria aurata]
MFPKKHSFSYSYLFVGIPVGWHGSLGSLLSADLEGCHTETEKIKPSQLQRRSWFHVEAADYLERGHHDLGLKGKLDVYLKSQNEDPEDYAHAYLITAPKFLGYSFNPVSFWYLYSEHKELKAMILEVNNTFDERRMYFLKCIADEGINKQRVIPIDKFEDGACDSPEETASAEVYRTSQSPAKFATKWAKDFHVSPFNSRKGSYSLNAYDPFFPELSGSGIVNNTVTLSSSKDHVKLVARIFSTQDAIDPCSLGGFERLRFVVAWWWVGFVTFPRIVREAGKLFFRRKLHVWFRPEVLGDSIGRRETADERIIEQCFRDFLRSLVESSKLEKPIKYTSAISIGPNVKHENFYPKSLRNKNQSSDTVTADESITLQIITPLFYSLLVLDLDPARFISISVQPSSPHPLTFHTSHPALLASLFSPSQLPDPPSPKPSSSNSVSMNPSEPSTRRCWSLLARLRRNPHALDQHSSRLPVVLRRQYRTTVLKLLLSDRLFFGLPIMADIVSAAVKVTLCYLYARTLVAILARSDSPVNSKDGRGSGGYPDGPAPERAVWIDVLGLMGIHVWRLSSAALGIVL